ncbi:Zinc finger protein 385B [Triplophysa tibetana]|uniref:Zinc finger protein 385B n=1 Tax=Triplophysa tibetana TaxID=1572043 RepID=A0A5A9P0X0_9TELE|nr:Zinc finger protein 385B [Triplophysa tibetana]
MEIKRTGFETEQAVHIPICFDVQKNPARAGDITVIPGSGSHVEYGLRKFITLLDWHRYPARTRRSPAMLLGSSCHSNTLPTLVRTSSLMMQSTLDMKSFMTFPMESSSPVGLFPNFNTVEPRRPARPLILTIKQLSRLQLQMLITLISPSVQGRRDRRSMDPVQKAVINHTFGVSIPPKKKQVISCNICQLRFNSDSQAEAHYKGSKHAKKLKAQETTKNKQKSAAAQDCGAKTVSISTTTNTTSCSSVSASCPDQPEKNSDPPAVHKSPVSPQVIMPAPAPSPVPLTPSPCKAVPPHASPPSEPSGQAAALKNTPKPAALPTAQTEISVESEDEKAKKLLYCSLCKVAVNSLSQLEAHNTGSKHKTMLEARNGAGPIKAYPRPGSKLKVQATQLNKGSGLQNKTFHCEICDVHVNSEIQLKQAKLALQNDLVKPISQAFLSTPFSATTVPSISLHPRPGTSIFQTAAFPPSFLRAAAGPIRRTAGSILFAPY